MLIPIVNEQDEIVCHIERSELDYSKHINRSSSCWVLDGKGNVLISQRSFGKSFDPGKWSESVGGTVDKDISYYQTIVNEMGEELGFNVDNYKLIQLEKLFINSSERYFVQWYSVLIDEPVEFFKIQKEELEAVAWMPIDQLRREVDEYPEKYISDMKQMLTILE